MSTAAVSKWLGISPRTLCLWAECREIPAIKVGRQWRFRESELMKWLQNPNACRMHHLAFGQAASAVHA